MSQKDPMLHFVELLTLLALMFKALWFTVVDAVKFVLPRTPRSVQGKVVLITGASRGLGRELALQFSALGAKVVLWSSKQSNVDTVARQVVQCGGSALAYECDVSDEDQVCRTARRVLEDTGRLDILINNAGVAHISPLLDTDPKEIRRVYDINLLAHYSTIRAFLPQMKKQGDGQVVAINSICSFNNGPRGSVYCGTKHAMLALMDCVEHEARESNIRFTTICPGFFESGLVTNIQNRLSLLFPLPTAEEVARATVRAVLTEETYIVIPRRVGFLAHLTRFFFSKRGQDVLQDYVNYTAEIVDR